jgi:hypothetical protein
MNINQTLALSFTVLLAGACADGREEPTEDLEETEQALTHDPWQPINQGLPMTDAGAPSVSSVAIDYKLPSLAYATTGAGLYESVDLGQHWSPSAGASPDGGTPVIVASDPNHLGSAYAGTTYFKYMTRDAVMFGTRNGGASWSAELTLPGGYVHALAVTPASGVVYAGWFGHDIWGMVRSRDRGATWTPVSVEGGWPCCDQLVAASSTHVLGLTFFGPYLAETTDGEGWHLVSSDISFREIAVDRRLPNVIYAASARTPGLLKSSDDGHTWSPPSMQLASAQVEHVSVSSVDGRVFALVREADRVVVYVSTDGAQTFQSAVGGLANEVYHIEPHPTLPCIAIALTDRGLYRTLSAGGTCY